MEAIVNELKRAEEAGEGLMEGAEEKMEALVEKAEAEFHKAAKRIEKITAEAEDDSPGGLWRATEMARGHREKP